LDVLFITQDFPPETGGLQTWSLMVAEGLARRGHRLTVLAPRAPRGFTEPAGLEMVRLDVPSDLTPIAAARTVARLRTKRRFDVVLHAQWQTAIATESMSWFDGVPRVVAAHGQELLINPLPVQLGLARRYDAFRTGRLRRADSVVAVSRFTAELCVSAGARPASVRVLPNGVDASTVTGGDGRRLREAQGWGDRPIVLSMSRLVARKGVDTLLSAWTRVTRHMPDALLVVAGAGPDEPRIRRIHADLRLGDRVCFFGAADEATRRDLFDACDLFVLAAQPEHGSVEGFGIALLEAGAAGKAVVAGRCGGIPDAVAVDESGLLFEPRDANALARRITMLLGDPGMRRRLGEGGRLRAQEFSAEAFALRWDQHLESVVESCTSR
jgi:phosphatidylinositol alpha-1,6-mannosyltransferase